MEIAKIKRREKEAFEERKRPMWRIFTVLKYIPPKFPSKLHRQLDRLSRKYDKAKGKPITQERILRTAMSLERRIKNRIESKGTA